MKGQRGFTLAELLVTLGAMTTLALFLLGAVSGSLHWSGMLSERRHAESALSGLADRLTADEDSAWAIFTPPQDVFNVSNSDGHELDFFMRDDRHRAYFWAYRYDKTAGTLQRYLFSAPGSTPVADGAPIAGITSFGARTHDATALQDPSSPVYSALYAGASLQAGVLRFGFAGHPWIAGGNQLTYVHVETAYSMRMLVLATETAPSGFTVVLQYTPAPTAAPTPPALRTALIEASAIKGTLRSCPDVKAGCSNAEWPQYYWNQTTANRSYQSTDGGYSWILTNTDLENTSGISTPTGGDAPMVNCMTSATFDYLYVCSTSWLPSTPPGTAGMDFSAPSVNAPRVPIDTAAPDPTIAPTVAPTVAPTIVPAASPRS